MIYPSNLFLVGLMGAGKTTVGRALAKRLDKTFLDSDLEIEARTGVLIPTIFEIEGEAGFREREKEAISALTQQKDIVLATGGGAVLAPENRAALRKNGVVIYLRASIDDLLLRTSHDKNRPLLQTTNPRATLEELYTLRDPLYQDVAHLVIDTSRQSVPALLSQIEPLLLEFA